MVSKVEPSSSSNHDKCPIKFIEGRKGKKLLVFDGYIFHINIQKNTTAYFKCSQKHKGCGARIVLKNWNKNNYTFDSYQITNGRHVNHLPDFEKIKRKKLQVQSEKAQDLNTPEFLQSTHVCLFCLSSLPPNYHQKTTLLSNVAPSGEQLAISLDNPTKNSQAFDLLCSLLNLKWRRFEEGGRTFDKTIPLPLCPNCQHLYQQVFQLNTQIRELEILINKHIKVIRDLVEKSGEKESEEIGQTQLAFLGLENFRRKVRDLTFNKFGCNDLQENDTPTKSSTVTKIEAEPEVDENLPTPESSPSSPNLQHGPIIKQEVNPDDEDNYQSTSMTWDEDTHENDITQDHQFSSQKEEAPSSPPQRTRRPPRLAAQKCIEKVTFPDPPHTSSDDNGGDSDSSAKINEDDSSTDLDSDTQLSPPPKILKRSPYRPRPSSLSLSLPLRHPLPRSTPYKPTKQYKCHICSKITIGLKSFSLHIQTDHPTQNSRYSCKFCNRPFSSFYKVTRHQLSHTGEKPFKCPHCPFATSHKQVLPAHILKKHSPTPENVPSIQCPHCPKKFPTDINLQNHLIASHDKPIPQKYYKKSAKLIQILTCHLCAAQVTGQGPFIQHYIDNHPDEKRFTCKFCHLHFKYIRDVLDHQRRLHTGERPFKCDKCDKCFITSRNLQSHLKFRHPDTPDAFGCPKCSRKFSSRSALTSHLYHYHSETLSFCKSCGISFRFKCQFKRHNEKEHGGTAEMSQFVKEGDNLEGLGIKAKRKCHICWKPLIGGRIFIQKHFDECHPSHVGGLNSCQCGKKCRNYASVVEHAMRHNKDGKGFQCDQCPHRSYSFQELRCHKESHVPVEERRGKYVCEVCGLGLASGATLWKHMNLHKLDGGGKGWVCEECGRSYREKRGLDFHRRKEHLRILPWGCDRCGKAFAGRSILKRHQRIHLGYKEFKCGRCEVAFFHETSRRRHEREVHGDGGGGKGRKVKVEGREGLLE